MYYQEEIQRYIPLNEQEICDRERMLWLAAQYGESLLTRENTVAHFTASAFVVDRSREQTLMVYHNIYQSWSWTGGHADGDSDLFRTAERELCEETGLRSFQPLMKTAAALDILTVQGHVRRGKYIGAHLHLNLSYLFEASPELHLRIKPDENSGVQWLNIAKLGSLCGEPHMMPIYNKLIDQARNL